MAHFERFNSDYINTNNIYNFQAFDDGPAANGRTRKGRIQISYRDDYCETYHTDSLNFDVAGLLGAHHIVQVISPSEPLYNVWTNEGEVFSERTYFLALCAEGGLRGLTLADGYFDTVDFEAHSGYLGLYDEQGINYLKEAAINSQSRSQ